MLRLVFGRPWRQTEGVLGLALSVPDHTTFSRRSVDLGVASALRLPQIRGSPFTGGMESFVGQ